ncbi:hypothetical protein DOTSEDRAFT_68597 [Dothistroma septosporum NZE10]|uniref:Uncharacterized protein n=1 Tax=Dothistroma septosporum (strain NZE10 / CBS 128990) TaxID=675120 RepID=N1Q2C0_DOTSN|nr:hypothetical protein DOTSEDRAFT_68597 [Dothistroma septosporum NZE10]
MSTKTAPDFVEVETPQVPMATSPSVEPVAAVKSQASEAFKDIVFGSTAGAAGKVIEYPFDTVKVRLQTMPDTVPPVYAGAWDCFKKSYAEGGMASLYRGIEAPMFGAAVETACLFWTYRLAKDFLRSTALPADVGEHLPLGALVTAGAMSGGVTSAALTPIELVKCRIQVPIESGAETAKPRVYKRLKPLLVIREVYRTEGIRGFWRGQLGTFYRETGGSAAWFGSYETLSLWFKKRAASDNIPIWQQMVSGAAAGMSYNISTFPADTIKSKIQTGELTTVRPTFMNVGKELWRSHGLKGLYRGCGITVARSAPSSALIFTCYEALRKKFG